MDATCSMSSLSFGYGNLNGTNENNIAKVVRTWWRDVVSGYGSEHTTGCGQAERVGQPI